MKLARTAAAVLCSAALASSMTLAVPTISQVADTAGITAGWSEQSSAYAAAIKLSKKSVTLADGTKTSTVTVKGVPNSAKNKVKWSASYGLTFKYAKKGDKRSITVDSCKITSGGEISGTITAKYKGKKYRCVVTVAKAAKETGVAKVMTAIENANGSYSNSDGNKVIKRTDTYNGQKTDTALVADRANNCVEVIALSTMGKTSTTISIKCTDEATTKVSFSYFGSDGMWFGNANIDKSAASLNATYKWDASSVSLKDPELGQKLADGSTNLALTYSDILLTTKTDLGISDLGFVNFK